MRGIFPHKFESRNTFSLYYIHLYIYIIYIIYYLYILYYIKYIPSPLSKTGGKLLLNLVAITVIGRAGYIYLLPPSFENFLPFFSLLTFLLSLSLLDSVTGLTGYYTVLFS